MTEDTIEAIRTRLKRHEGRYPAIAEHAEVSYSWLQKFANGERGKRPSFEQIDKLTKTLDHLDAAEVLNG